MKKSNLNPAILILLKYLSTKKTNVIILIFTVFTCFGQVEPSENNKSDFKKFQIGFNFSPDLSYRYLINNDGSLISKSIIEHRNEEEIVKLGYTSGLNFCYNINKNIGFQTGVQFSNKGYQTKKQNLTSLEPDRSLPNQSKFVYNFRTIDIPVNVNFTFGKNKLRFFTSIGVTTNIFIQETQTNYLYFSNNANEKWKEKITTSSDADYNHINVTPTLSVGIDYKINNMMNLRVEPTFRYGVMKNINTPVSGHLYNGGLNISYFFNI